MLSSYSLKNYKIQHTHTYDMESYICFIHLLALANQTFFEKNIERIFDEVFAKKHCQTFTLSPFFGSAGTYPA